MRILAGVLGALLLLVQYPLWLGKGGWLRVWDLDGQVAVAQRKNGQLELRNGALEAEVSDLKQGVEAIEERARYELGLVKNDEVFFQVVEKERAPAAGASAPAVTR
jgi:cell division protein FtsB